MSDFTSKGSYDTGADFWRDLAVSYGIKEAAGICGRYFDTQISTDSKEENQFCKELFTAMYEDTAGRANPSKIVYPYSFAYASDRTEQSAYHDSRKRTEACAGDIDNAINASCYEQYHYNMEAAARKVVSDHGFERVNTVLARNLQNRSYDGRFSDANKKWAESFDLGDRALGGTVLAAHPVLIDGFTKNVREMYAELDAERFALPGRPEQGDHVQNYEITRSIQFDNERGFAMGHNPDAVEPFVTWQFTAENGARDFYWGRYFDSEAAAGENFCARVSVYMQNEQVRELLNPIAAVELSTEQNYNMIDGLRNNLAYEKADLTDGQTHEEIRELAPETLPDSGEKPSLLGRLEKIKSEMPPHTPIGHSEPPDREL